MLGSKLNSPSGQGLLETIVAIGIILSGLIGVVGLTVSNLTVGTATQSRLQAANLAREGIEAARAIRDGAWLQGAVVPWYDCPLSSGLNCLSYTSTAGDITAVPMLDPVSFQWTMYFTPNDFNHATALIYRDQNSIYRQAVVTPIASAATTAFRRLLELYPICRNQAANQESSSATTCGGGQVQVGVRVVAEVEWAERGNTHELVLEDFLYNWRYATIPNTP